MNDTAMTIEQTWRAVAAERASLAELLASLSEHQWDHDSLCADWRIRDVVAHIALSSNSDIATILVNLIRARLDLHGMIRDTAIRHAENTTAAQLLAELRAGIQLRRTPVGTTPADRLMDLLVHGQDIAIPLGITREMPIAAARLSLERVWTMGATFEARKQLAGNRLVANDIDWTAGEGPVIEAPVGELLLLVTGRRTVRDLQN